MSNEFSTPKLTPADAVKIPGVDGNNDSGYLLSKEVKDYMVGGLEGDVQDYSTLETYTVGQRVKNEGDLYRCKTAVEVPEVFDPTKWDKIDIPSLDERVLENAEDIATNATNIQANTDAITSLSGSFTTLSNSSSDTAVANDTAIDIVSLEVPAGRWFFEGICTFKSGGTSAYGTYVRLTNVTADALEVAGPPGAYAVIHTYGMVYFSSTTTVKLNIRHRYGSALDCVGTIKATKMA